jgi:hypothetical protein
MHSTSVIRGFLIGSLVAIGSLLSLAVVNYSGGMQNLWGTSNITNAAPGQVYFNTDSNTLWVGGVSSNPVKVGTAGVASTNDINTAVANRPITNAWNTLSLVITNSHPGTNAWLRSDDGTNLYWQAAP